MRAKGRPRVPRCAPTAVAHTCASCGKAYACVRCSLADEMGLCLRCFERKVRFPELCQRP
jgi:recombinational DNA repair protein (RecF pathway)